MNKAKLQKDLVQTLHSTEMQWCSVMEYGPDNSEGWYASRIGPIKIVLSPEGMYQ